MKRNKIYRLNTCECGCVPRTILGWRSDEHNYGFYTECSRCGEITEVCCSKHDAERAWNNEPHLVPTVFSKLMKKLFKNRTLTYRKKK